ncbi:MAG: exodeoxyribonuclease III [Tetrasphaera sp.]
MKVATWNVNSIRSRIERVIGWLEHKDVDVLAIQETKTREDQFPFFRFEELGYQVAHHGVNQWNGVAIASRVGLDDVAPGFANAPTWGQASAAEARVLAARCGGIRMVSVYAPNGRHIADPHMDYKIEWLTRLRDQAGEWLADGPTILMGDWNIAPQDDDVWSMEYYLDKSHVSPRERAAFAAFLDAGFVDPVRPILPGPKVYTYWDYQQLRFQKRRGMRIDFLLASPDVAARVSGALIDREERKGKGASDHAPVVIEVADG